jgi:hypothetical protein
MDIMRASIQRVLPLAKVEAFNEPEQHWGRTMEAAEI